ncbi:MAG: hypothetical protein OT477_16100 [Chloroflexi bacterium]|nr:hypothetical protein [Chloroflexota bacterium]
MQTQTTEVDRPTLTVFVPLNHKTDDEPVAVVYELDIIMGERLDIQHGAHQTAYILELQDTLGSHHIQWLEAVGAVYRYDVPAVEEGDNYVFTGIAEGMAEYEALAPQNWAAAVAIPCRN